MKTKKKIAPVSRKIKRVAKKKTNVLASSATAIKAKSNAEKTAQPGIIASIIAILSDAKKSKVMLTVSEIAAKLSVQFPDRAVTGMTTTIRAQLSRLPNERDFEIKKTRDGREVRYAAA